MQYYSNTFACVHHEKDVSKSLVFDICINNAICCAILMDDKDDDNLIWMSKAFEKETHILKI